MYYIGFWSDSKYTATADRPWPVATVGQTKDVREFVDKLERVEKITPAKHYRGMSTCRICKQMNGSKEYNTDQWTWPEGYLHYIKDHGVEVPFEFVNYILEFPLETEYKLTIQKKVNEAKKKIARAPTLFTDDVTVNFYSNKMRNKAEKMLNTVAKYLDFMESIKKPHVDFDQLDACLESIKPMLDTFGEMACTQVDSRDIKRTRTR